MNTPIDERVWNGKTIYPGMVGMTLGVQVVVYIAMYRLMIPGAKVFRLWEEEKDKRYTQVHGDGFTKQGAISSDASSVHASKKSGYICSGPKMLRMRAIEKGRCAIKAEAIEKILPPPLRSRLRNKKWLS